MSRSRGTVEGGYVRKTISLPKNLLDNLEAHLEKHPGDTLSKLLSDAGEEFLRQQKKKGR